MIVTRLKFTNLRAIEAAEFRFRSGINLIVGINGVGKTTVLDALCACLSPVVKRANKLRGPVGSFPADDIRIGAGALTVECDIQIGTRDYSYVVHKSRESSTPREKMAGVPRQQVLDTPETGKFVGDAPPAVTGGEAGGRALVVAFSTSRAVPSERIPGKASAGGGTAGAFADALANRHLRLGEFAAWMQAQEALGREAPASASALAVCQNAVERFLPGYRNLRQDGQARPRLWIDRDGTTLPVRQLSDGERGSLALVLDLTRRLAQANPELAAPASEAEAVVLIDEIDLHLHPTWQRQIVCNLTTAFPRCQFIATTHSPQVVGEVPHERIQIVVHGQVYSPTHSFGVDSSRVLEEIMDADPRTREVQKLLTEISEVVGSRQFGRGRELLRRLAARLGQADPEVMRLQTLLDFMEGQD